ncbi:TauD/TfdA family dioxygenase [Novosphingobium sp.]|uniref:TauD/TfdA dioxygenase family protein n=1 Tax=Novosphingobium sp. TaxID=1874826 RepID=UPI001ED5960C|nr:TauD/TfdA family dioxygenase [Novosphingobium sp.]MBK6802208.1 TauD/TfdA family dioxygenase [Novosphingobium sp.]MBK9009736.1 TauD/TfdA family dioxygenase [Novosphingobium sp.]
MREVRLSPSGGFDNAALPASHIEVRPVAAAMGAEVMGDLRDLSGDAFAELRQALWRHKMLFARGQHWTHAEHEAFALRWGPFAPDAYTHGVAGHPGVQPLIKEADHRSKGLFGSGWHTDSPFLPEPPGMTILRSVEVPPYGGDTVWANCALAYRTLSPAMQTMLRPLKVRMSAVNNAHTQKLADGKELNFASDEAREAAFAGNAHPLVRTHPMTGELALFVDEVYAVGIEGMTQAESLPLLDFLCRHITQHHYTVRLKWEPGMVAMWDNRGALHLAANDYDGFRREMYRTTMAGERPE